MAKFDVGLFFGESHTGSVRTALSQRSDPVHRALNICHIEYPANEGLFEHPLFAETLKPAPNSRPLYISMLGGNAHNFLGLVVREKPFDFILPGEPDLESEPGYEPQTYGFVESVMRSMMLADQRMLQAARAAISGRIVQIESPPPVADNEYIRENISQHLNPLGLLVKITCPILRYKLWRIQSDIMSSICRSIDIDYIRAPSESLIDGRYLRPNLIQDVTHANGIYGELVLAQIEERMAS